MHGIGRQKVMDEYHDSVAHFIWCVRKRPALYNYKLPKKDRRRVDVARMWQELATEIGNVTAVECRKKWKNLRDTYHQYRLRKVKYKDCLEKWRYTADLSFLNDVYQPKLKSERHKYVNTFQKHEMHEAKTSESLSLIELDEETIDDQNDEYMDEHILIEDDDFKGNIEDVIDMDQVQFCDVNAENVKHVEVCDELYDEVHLYDESESKIVENETLLLPMNSNSTDFKEIIISSNYQASVPNEMDGDRAPVSEHLTIGNNKDELDLFFQFLKSKIQKLPSVDITAIQIEFLNAVLRRESAHATEGENSGAE